MALVTAGIAGLVALIGYMMTQAANRRERKSRLYAEALSAVREYQELPYRVRRRPSSDNKTRAELGAQISAVMTKLGFYVRFLQLDSHEVGIAYTDLVNQVRRMGGPYRSQAWRASLVASDEEMPLVKYPYETEPEMSLCLKAMRHELAFWGFLFRPSIRRSLALQRQIRAAKGEAIRSIVGFG